MNNEINICVLIPTYNNSGTVAQVIADVQQFTNNIIVVNDGSTDNTKRILADISDITVMNFAQNQGKGKALREGFKRATELGFTHAITLDSDGQHKASDLPIFFSTIAQKPNALFIGARNMNQENVPGTSSFGHKFSNFWFKFETGIDAPDTQSGYRAYPIYLLKNTRFFTTKYEFEIEVIVRAAWKKIPIEFLPINVYYPPQEERISHFRKVPDFTRISILNTLLVTFAILYFKPKKFIENLFAKH
ncbi:MAG TPA: glycosyltransferase family 2 protein [Chitinophagales bacterium]